MDKNQASLGLVAQALVVKFPKSARMTPRVCSLHV